MAAGSPGALLASVTGIQRLDRTGESDAVVLRTLRRGDSVFRATIIEPRENDREESGIAALRGGRRNHASLEAVVDRAIVETGVLNAGRRRG